MIFFKDGPFLAYFSLFSSFLFFLIVQLVDKILSMLGLKCESLVLEATALPTDPPPLPMHELFNVFIVTCVNEAKIP